MLKHEIEDRIVGLLMGIGIGTVIASSCELLTAGSAEIAAALSRR